MEIKNEELLNICVKIEKEGQVFNKELANHISDPVVKDYLLIVSEEKAQHENHFKKVLKEKRSHKYGWEDSPDLHSLVDKNFTQGNFIIEKGESYGLANFFCHEFSFKILSNALDIP
jgi:rubrerythrin